ncbi:oligosaccharide flippase family protein [Bacteroides thetaiotaomicron]|nr:oligosaccharide flippase family protein [Bacteroides thetaiotaomicron]MDR5581762.1 oligosaccharide flippase family protein [Bacteroides thetaiotaomicron]UVO74497.1 oligosaccharide flippase family protein [Bacteroides thetaiotaomicron]UVQ70395.1 oligosaccharide flippase family protein [Bacteroides thetaiotaomicron]
MNSDIRSMGISGVKWASIGRFSSQGISFVLGLILARLLLPSDYGMLGMLGVFTAFAGSFIDCGFGSALIRKLDRTEIDCSTVFYYNLGASLLVYMVMFLGAPFIADFYKQPLLTNVTRIACLTIPIGALCSVHSNLLYCQLRFRDIAIGNILATFFQEV